MRTPHREDAMTNDGRLKVTFNLRSTVITGPLGLTATVEIHRSQRSFSSAQSRQPPEPESSIRVPGHVPCDSDHRDSSRCLARALAPQVCDTQVPGTLALEAAEDHGVIHGGGGVLLGIDGGYGGALPSQPPQEHGLRPTGPDSDVRGQHRVHRVGEPRHRRVGARQAH